ncbi:hypothetical protein ACFW3D_33930 [Streptomyces sp. NPDC058864]
MIELPLDPVAEQVLGEVTGSSDSVVVDRMKELWEPWEEPHLVLDSAVASPEANLGRVPELDPESES